MCPPPDVVVARMLLPSCLLVLLISMPILIVSSPQDGGGSRKQVCRFNLQCEKNEKCQSGFCVNPCGLLQCGQGAKCQVSQRKGQCVCPAGTEGNPLKQCEIIPECRINSQCGNNESCQSGVCVDPCVSIKCGQGASCQVSQRQPQCLCPDNTKGDPLVQCQATQDCNDDSHCGDSERCSLGSCVNKCDAIQCGKGAICQMSGNNPQCICPANTEGNPLNGCQPIQDSSGENIGEASSADAFPGGTSGHIAIPQSDKDFLFALVGTAPNESVSSSTTPVGVITAVGETFSGTCGHSTMINDGIIATRIANGRPTISGKYPWMAHFSYFSSFFEKLVPCGGTLINKRWVLSAAHCFRFLKPNIGVIVKIGFLNLNRQEPESVVYSITKEKIIQHDGFSTSSSSLENDIALARMPNDVPFSDLIQPICLGTNQNLPFGSKGWAAGWGLLKRSDAEIPNDLHEVELDILPEESCSNQKHFICTFTPGKDTCSGDSGGPLMVLQDNQWFQYGIVSHGPMDCGVHTSPGVYTRVPNHLPFIETIVNIDV